MRTVDFFVGLLKGLVEFLVALPVMSLSFKEDPERMRLFFQRMVEVGTVLSMAVAGELPWIAAAAGLPDFAFAALFTWRLAATREGVR